MASETRSEWCCCLRKWGKRVSYNPVPLRSEMDLSRKGHAQGPVLKVPNGSRRQKRALYEKLEVACIMRDSTSDSSTVTKLVATPVLHQAFC
ncbi:hypothetical protein TNCV_2504861 [Trichonephila clavipes]|uniref:Uncharacterized protein n=1 Tax=Trichonephila clavipes TaxID=2585209 RepID=A0A8X6WFV6_TRICX|nr:hypothetical protein TNCV_2504861 [Trichonephila clavipes]